MDPEAASGAPITETISLAAVQARLERRAVKVGEHQERAKTGAGVLDEFRSETRSPEEREAPGEMKWFFLCSCCQFRLPRRDDTLRKRS